MSGELPDRCMYLAGRRDVSLQLSTYPPQFHIVKSLLRTLGLSPNLNTDIQRGPKAHVAGRPKRARLGQDKTYLHA
ncbi:MAG: hypothetical protein GWP14_03820 [Actinobacteria bacterium]|nr:hypothetical protein [Actinomycetota bacterium]